MTQPNGLPVSPPDPSPKPTDFDAVDASDATQQERACCHAETPGVVPIAPGGPAASPAPHLGGHPAAARVAALELIDRATVRLVSLVGKGGKGEGAVCEAIELIGEARRAVVVGMVDRPMAERSDVTRTAATGEHIGRCSGVPPGDPGCPACNPGVRFDGREPEAVASRGLSAGPWGDLAAREDDEAGRLAGDAPAAPRPGYVVLSVGDVAEVRDYLIEAMDYNREGRPVEVAEILGDLGGYIRGRGRASAG